MDTTDERRDDARHDDTRHDDTPRDGAGDGDARRGDHHSHGVGGSPECHLCPICVVLQALGGARPDVTAHLLAAAREIAIAVKTAAEGQVEGANRAQAVMNDRLTRINID